jgi:hypothetical protein
MLRPGANDRERYLSSDARRRRQNAGPSFKRPFYHPSSTSATHHDSSKHMFLCPQCRHYEFKPQPSAHLFRVLSFFLFLTGNDTMFRKLRNLYCGSKSAPSPTTPAADINDPSPCAIHISDIKQSLTVWPTQPRVLGWQSICTIVVNAKGATNHQRLYRVRSIPGIDTKQLRSSTGFIATGVREGLWF